MSSTAGSGGVWVISVMRVSPFGGWDSTVFFIVREGRVIICKRAGE